MRNDSDHELEREFETLEHAIPEATAATGPQKEIMPKWLIESFRQQYPELDWSTDDAIRANFKIIWKQKQEPDAK